MLGLPGSDPKVLCDSQRELLQPPRERRPRQDGDHGDQLRYWGKCGCHRNSQCEPHVEGAGIATRSHFEVREVSSLGGSKKICITKLPQV